MSVDFQYCNQMLRIIGVSYYDIDGVDPTNDNSWKKSVYCCYTIFVLLITSTPPILELISAYQHWGDFTLVSFNLVAFLIFFDKVVLFCIFAYSRNTVQHILADMLDCDAKSYATENQQPSKRAKFPIPSFIIRGLIMIVFFKYGQIMTYIEGGDLHRHSVMMIWLPASLEKSPFIELWDILEVIMLVYMFFVGNITYWFILQVTSLICQEIHFLSKAIEMVHCTGNLSDNVEVLREQGASQHLVTVTAWEHKSCSDLTDVSSAHNGNISVVAKVHTEEEPKGTGHVEAVVVYRKQRKPLNINEATTDQIENISSILSDDDVNKNLSIVEDDAKSDFDEDAEDVVISIKRFTVPHKTMELPSVDSLEEILIPTVKTNAVEQCDDVDLLPDDEEICKNLVRNIQRHQNIIRISNDFQEVFSSLTRTIYFANKLSVGLCGFSLAVVTKVSDPSLPRTLFLFVASLLHLFIWCLNGERLIKACNDLHTSVYNCRWYQMSKRAKYFVAMLLMRTQTPIQFAADIAYVTSMALFVTSVNEAYSIYNMLRSSYQAH